MTAEQFLDQLEAQHLLDDAIIARLRKQLAEATFEVTAKNIAGTLVKQGHLTKFQAEKMLGGGSSKKATRTDKTEPKKSQPKKADPTPANDDVGLESAPLDESQAGSDWGLAADDDDEAEEAEKPAAASDGLEPMADDDGLEPIDDGGLEPLDADGLEPIEESGLEPIDDGGLEPIDDGGLEPIDAGGLEPIDDGGLEPIDDDGLTGLDDPMMADEAMQAPAAPGQQKGPGYKKKEARKKPWESPLILAGGGSLVGLLIIGTIIWLSLYRGTAAEMFQEAEEAYRSEAFAQAISIYEKFLNSYPDDPNVSKARCKIGMANIWQKVKAGKDKRPALAEAKTVLPTIEAEEAFSDVRPDLSTALPDIAEGFSEPAKLTEDIQTAQQLVDLATEAMVLVDNPTNIPTSLRRSIQRRIDKITEDIELAKRNINRTKRLAEAVKKIRELAEAGKTDEAYEIRRALLRDYPGLDRHPELLAAVLIITENERALVKVLDTPIDAVTEDHPKTTRFRVALVSRRGDGFTGNEKQAVFFLARGSVFALHAPTGKLLWRRFVGHETIYQPLPLSRQAGADVLVSDTLHQELARLDGATGELKWRLPIGEEFAEPYLYGKRVFVATQSGRLLDIDTDSGVATRHVVIPQPLEAAPGTGDRQHLYQVGDHSNLYVLAADSFECKEVYYVGHKAGTIVTPPVMALGHLFIAENNATDGCDLHILSVDANGLDVKPPMKPIRLKGRVVVPPILYSGRVVVLTDLGEIRVFEVNTAKPEQPVSEAVDPQVASFRQPMISFATVDAGALYVGNDRLTKYIIQTSRSQLNRDWIRDERDAWDAAPVVFGDTVFDLRRRKGSPAFTVTARNIDDGKALWATDIAIPTSLVNVDLEKREIHAINAQAELFEVTSEAFQKGFVDEATTIAVGATRTAAFTEVVDMGDGRFALASPEDRSKVVVYNPRAVSASGRLESVIFSSAIDSEVTATPVFFQDGLIVPLDDGQIILADAKTGANKILPFQPRVEAGSKIVWQSPAVVDDGAAFVIADSRRNLFKVGIEDKPEPHLERIALAQLEVDIVAPLTSAGNTVYGVIRTGVEDTLVAFASSDLSVGKEWPLEGRLMWGPKAVGDVIMVASDRGGLKCFDGDQTLLWQTELNYGPLAGTPLADGPDYILTSQSGVVWKISGADGSELAKKDIEEPLASGAMMFATRFLISTADGAMLVVDPLSAPAGN